MLIETYRSPIRCLIATFCVLFSEQRRVRVAETLKKKQRNAAEFLSSILHHANSFSMFWIRAAIGIKIRWHCNALQICKYATGTNILFLQSHQSKQKSLPLHIFPLFPKKFLLVTCLSQPPDPLCLRWLGAAYPNQPPIENSWVQHWSG